jgi:hypothetical protein
MSAVGGSAANSADGTKLEARGRIELPIKVLQTFALPLGYRAMYPDLRNSVEAGWTAAIIIALNGGAHLGFAVRCRR